MEALVLHGGQGTRLRPLTHTGPKQLIKVAGKPVSRWVIEHIRDSGITDIVLLLGDNNPSRVIEYYGDGSKLGVKISYVYQGKAMGLADAVYRARELLGERFVVYLGDNIVLHDLSPLVNFNASASILLARVSNPNRFGVAAIKDGKVVRLVEKPKEPISDLALVGVYAFTSEIFDVIKDLKPSGRGELEITDAIQGLIDKGKSVEHSVVTGWWKDTGTPEDLLEANMFLLDKFAKRESAHASIQETSVEGRVYVERGSIVEGSKIRGPVFIGENSRIENSFIGPFTSVGDNCVVRRAEIENSIVLDHARIEGISLSDSIIGQGAEVSKNSGRVSKLVIGESSRVMF